MVTEIAEVSPTVKKTAKMGPVKSLAPDLLAHLEIRLEDLPAKHRDAARDLVISELKAHGREPRTGDQWRAYIDELLTAAD